MNFFTSPQKQPHPRKGNSADVQAAPLSMGTSTDEKLKVDVCLQVASSLIVAGWCTTNHELGLTANGALLKSRRLDVARPDVATHFGLPSGNRLGFVLIAQAVDDQTVSLTWRSESAGQVQSSVPLKVCTAEGMSSSDLHALGAAVGLMAQACEPFSEQWLSLIAWAQPVKTSCHSARGYLEGAAACDKTGEAVVVGWVVSLPGTQVWLEDDSGRKYSLDHAFRTYRRDVQEAVGAEYSAVCHAPGFVARTPKVSAGSNMAIKALSDEGVHVLAEVECIKLPAEAVGAARWLFSVATPIHEMHRRVQLVDQHVLTPLIEQRVRSWEGLHVVDQQIGSPCDDPSVSVIVPLYGRTDFVEHQLIEFSKDPWITDHAEIVYVVDDPSIGERFVVEAHELHRLYRVPMRVVWGNANRGFSGANNLGAERSRAKHLLFLNSDAFPQEAGWLSRMIGVLESRPDIGAVGPRLLFADGSIQHAGMDFMRLEELGIWVNHHPSTGLSPTLDPRRELTLVPCVTGACIAVRRADLERVGGWDTGYLIGDFEDSDLCLKLRAQGLHIAYLPDVQLTHLERQSFKLVGQDAFRMGTVLFNALRHQARWLHSIEALASRPKGNSHE